MTDCGCGGGLIGCKTYGIQNQALLKNMFFSFVGVIYLLPWQGKIFLSTAISLFGISKFLPNYFNFSKQDFVSYLPLSKNSTIFESLKKIESSEYMKGNSNENNLLIAQSSGSHIFGGAGLNLNIGASNVVDHFYFSMCSTKIINNTVNEIQNFESNLDKIHLFCTKNKITPNQITIKHINNESFIEIETPSEELIAIAINGEIHLNDIILNDGVNF